MRISRGEMFLRMVEAIAPRSTCLRKQVGALVALDGRVLSIGYAGSPAGTPHCLDAGCIISPIDGGCMRTQHAEANCIAWAARKGISLEGGVMYATFTPCLACAKLLINSGIKGFHALEKYRDQSGIALMKSVGIETLVHVPGGRQR